MDYLPDSGIFVCLNLCYSDIDRKITSSHNRQMFQSCEWKRKQLILGTERMIFCLFFMFCMYVKKLGVSRMLKQSSGVYACLKHCQSRIDSQQGTTGFFSLTCFWHWYNQERGGSSDRSFMVDPLSYFLFQLVLHYWCTKTMVCPILSVGWYIIKDLLLLIKKSIPYSGGSWFLLWLALWP